MTKVYIIGLALTLSANVPSVAEVFMYFCP